MNLSRAQVLVAIGLFLALAFNDAKPHRRGLGRSGRLKEDSGERHRHGQPFIACSLNDVTMVTEGQSCPEGIECNQGPLLVSVDVEGVIQDQSIKFCNLPPKPDKEDICNIKNADGTDVEPLPELTVCEGDQTCSYGSYEGRDGKQVFTCSEVPSVDYIQAAEDRLHSEACKVGNELQECSCTNGKKCEGMKVTVNGTELTFCPKPEFEGDEQGDEKAINVLDLLNRRRGGPDCEDHHGPEGLPGGRRNGRQGGHPRSGGRPSS